MRSWTIHVPPGDPRNVANAERFVAVKDGLRPLAVVLGPLWFLTKRLWLAALVAAIVEIALLALLWWLALPRPVAGLITALWHGLVGLEASSLQRWTLRRRGWREIGAVIAHGRLEAEVRGAGLTAGDAAEAAPSSPRPQPANAPSPPLAAQPVLGLFPEARP